VVLNSYCAIAQAVTRFSEQRPEFSLRGVPLFVVDSMALGRFQCTHFGFLMPVIAAVHHSHLPSTFLYITAFVVTLPKDWLSYHPQEKEEEKPLDVMCWT